MKQMKDNLQNVKKRNDNDAIRLYECSKIRLPGLVKDRKDGQKVNDAIHLILIYYSGRNRERERNKVNNQDGNSSRCHLQMMTIMMILSTLLTQ
jgi:hypothetical protein